MKTTYFAVCAPGLQPYLAGELQDLGLVPQAAAPGATDDGGGCEFTGSLLDLYRANLHLRTCSRVLLRFGQFYAASFSELRKKASRLPWGQILQPGSRIALRVTCHKSKLYHSSAVAERVAGAIADQLGGPLEIQKFDENTSETPPQLILVRLQNDTCTISIDSSGSHLHRRGYKLAVAKAPLRETLAAGLLLASGWQPNCPLMDPFCGSGTIPIEAARLARRVAPGLSRDFAFMRWPGFDAASWNGLKSAAISQQVASAAPILASDRDAGAIEMARANALRAGVLDSIQFDCQAVSDLQPPARAGWLITNPPYGVRVSGGKDLRNLYSQFGKVLRLHCDGWQVGILCSDEILLGHTGLKLDTSLRLNNGGISVVFGRGTV